MAMKASQEVVHMLPQNMVSSVLRELQQRKMVSASNLWYCISKYTNGLLGPRGIRVNALAPGSIWTPLMAKAEAILDGKQDQPSAMHRMGTAEEVS